MNLPSILEQNQQIVFKDIAKIIFNNQNAKYITIRNSIISECIFNSVNIDNCDFICNKVCDSEFHSVSFGNADIFSTWFSNCIFTDIDFTGASIEDITFENCKFERCIFKNISLKKCIFNNCTLIGIKPDSSVFSLNEYNLSNFIDCFFIGSFQYQIFNNCSFSDVCIASSILQYNFGLGNFSEIKYVHNKKIVDDIRSMEETLVNDCAAHKLFINAVIVNYNFVDYINPVLAIKSIKALGKMLNSNMLLCNDELTFIKQLYHYFLTSNLIAPIAIYQMFEEIKKIYANPIDNIAYTKCKDSIYMIANSLFLDFNYFCNDLIKSIEEIPHYVEPAYIQIHYNEEPSLSLAELFNRCIPNVIHRIKTMQGSFIEYFEIGQNGLELLKIFIQLLGISVPIIYSEIKMKKKANIKTDESTIHMEVKINTAIQNEHEISDLIQQTCQIATNSNLLNINLQGYNNSNVKDIKIEYQVSSQS